MPAVSILILTYNSERFIVSFLDSLAIAIKEYLDRVELILVDNASSDKTLEIVKSSHLHKFLKIIESRENMGYAKGVNLAAKRAHGKLLMVINPDASVIDIDFEKIIKAFSDDENIAVAGLTIFKGNGIREKTAGKFYNPFTFLMFCLGLEKLAGLRFSPEKVTKVDFVSGGFIVFRRDFFEKLNGYDEDYFMYVEDMDFCFRVKRNGHSTYFFPYGSIKHFGQGSSSREFAIINIYNGLSRFYKKHGSFIELEYAKSLLSLKAGLIIFIGSLFGNKEKVSIYLKALKQIE